MMINQEEKEQFERRKNLICELIDDDMYVPMKEKELAAFMQVSREEREAFRNVLQALLSEARYRLLSRVNM